MLNLNFSQRVVIDSNQMDWLSSPASGVLRKPLEREAKESGHTTSIVEYKKGASFSFHPHPMGNNTICCVFSSRNHKIYTALNT